ncbi:MAG: CsgG/HfaB family protein [Fibrobacterota bacterium]
MIKKVLLCVSFFTLFFTGCAGRNIIKGNVFKKDGVDFIKGKYAIFPFKSAGEGKTMTGRVSTDGNAIADMLTIQMLAGGYNIAERDKIDKVLEEAGFAQAVGVKDDKAIVDMGKLLGVSRIVYGSVIQYEQVSVKKSWHLALGISARIIDVKTGEPVLVCTATGTGNNISEVLNGISEGFVKLLEEDKYYVWQ